MWEVNGRLHFLNHRTHHCAKVLGRMFMFFDKKVSKSSEFYYLEHGLHLSISDIFGAINTLIQGRHDHSEICLTVKLSRRIQKVEIYLAKERSGLASFITDLGHIFGSNVGNDFGVLLRGKGPHKPKFPYDIVLIHSLMIYTDLIQHNIFGDPMAPLLRCFPFSSTLKTGDNIATTQYINCQIFNNVRVRTRPKKTS